MPDVHDEALLVVDGLAVERSGRRVLEHVSFAIASGESVAIVGPNGAGKTTLLLAMMGLLVPARGRVLLQGRALRRFGGRQAIARHIAYVPQQYDGFTGFTVRDMVAGGRYAHHGPFALHTAVDQRIIDDALSACGLTALQHRLVSRLSGGERQKVWLAAAIAQESALLFLDEPTTALDPRHQADLIRLLRHLHGQGRTLVTVCHDLNLAVALQARVLALDGGGLRYDEPIAEFLAGEHPRSLFGIEFERLQSAGGQARVLPRV